ncbi:hypothetical protein NPIL_402791 [Nephila pilipes]|uniref:Uncharacterized protein n=1 Tax=Nephila pilipes TaxID=299642 RepID=A0A8X6UE91_NEPPI|nr:hypothetical protein NPIL_402791 [Nephila pilipes]
MNNDGRGRQNFCQCLFPSVIISVWIFLARLIYLYLDKEAVEQDIFIPIAFAWFPVSLAVIVILMCSRF